jgi:Flp pilus assembly protein TadD
MTQWFMVAIAGTIILWLVGIISALLFGLITPPVAPRTALERAVNVYGAQVRAGSSDSQIWAAYIGSLIDAGQRAQARATIDAGLRSSMQNKSVILEMYARLQFVSNDYAGCIKTCDQVMSLARTELADRNALYVASGIKQSGVLPTSYNDAVLLKANAQSRIGDYKGAVKTYDAYLVLAPTDSDVMVLRAAAKVKIGDRTGAEKDYRQALKYIPDYQPALDGLKKIGVSR